MLKTNVGYTQTQNCQYETTEVWTVILFFPGGLLVHVDLARLPWWELVRVDLARRASTVGACRRMRRQCRLQLTCARARECVVSCSSMRVRY